MKVQKQRRETFSQSSCRLGVSDRGFLHLQPIFSAPLGRHDHDTELEYFGETIHYFAVSRGGKDSRLHDYIPL